MCIIAIAHRASTRYPLIVAANRDESHARATSVADWWADAPDVLGGRDLVAGGTWLAVDRHGRFAAVTNLRGESPPAVNAKSRGLLVSRYLDQGSATTANAVVSAAEAALFGPFNMLAFDGSTLSYTSNRAPPSVLQGGVHALSNAEPDAQWPKVVRARQGMNAVLDEPDPAEPLFALLAEREQPTARFNDRQVSLFQKHPVWGTRSSTVVLMDARRKVRFIERSFNETGAPMGEVRFEFTVRAPTGR